MRRLVRVLVAAAAPVALLSLGACSSSSTPLAQLTSSAPSTSATASPTSSAAPTSDTTTTSAARTSLQVTKDPLPTGLSADASAAAQAWFAYWDFVGAALTDPTAATAISGVGKVATGQAASDLTAQVQGQQQAGQRIVGTTRVQVRSATASGTAGTVCSAVVDISNSVDRNGKDVNPAIPRTPVFSATMKLDGPTWRVAKIDRVESC